MSAQRHQFHFVLVGHLIGTRLCVQISFSSGIVLLMLELLLLKDLLLPQAKWKRENWLQHQSAHPYIFSFKKKQTNKTSSRTEKLNKNRCLLFQKFVFCPFFILMDFRSLGILSERCGSRRHPPTEKYFSEFVPNRIIRCYFVSTAKFIISTI